MTSSNRTFQSKWKTEFTWLEYDGEAATCSQCVAADKQGLLIGAKRRDAAFTTKGFNTWRHALERFRRHEASDVHQLAIQALASASRPCAAAALSVVGKAREQSDARHALRRIFDAVAFCSKQGLALRRRDECGNVIQYLQDMAQKDAPLKAWMSRRSAGTLHYT